MKNLIAVDIFDNPIGKISKTEAHKKPILHRAFSVFLYNNDKILIQQRALDKYHSGGLWANTCCSHPRSNDIKKDASLRLKEEIGADLSAENLQEIFSFTYMTKFADNLYEYEFDHVLVGEYSGDFVINKEEVNDLIWVDIKTLSEELQHSPQKFASWFLICAPKVIAYLNKKAQV